MIRDLVLFLTSWALWLIAITAFAAYCVCATFAFLALIFTKGPAS